MVKKIIFSRHQIQPDDTILNFRMKDATKLKEVKVIPKKEYN